ncbi:uncharacterized protein LOC130048313 isoform X3 [Ostrea edulis]|uniref:uncharacterized protein LOC130048313 isoform X3 n=1 Tax=Ostrea edulis TaxID=37623 RepID=UPI0024AFBEB8|nr:uncharacterized protein LOC130048313 isoform X3 [Ostrea edulis]
MKLTFGTLLTLLWAFSSLKVKANDDSDKENLLNSALRRLSENILDSPEETLANSPLNIKEEYQDNSENYDTDHLKTQNNLDENCSDSLHFPIKEYDDGLDEPNKQDPDVNDVEHQKSKKYSEFLGKRFSEFLGKRGLPKRYSEFLGKRLGQGKRFSEFLGKRSDDKNLSHLLGKKSHIRKRYSEFLGKRYSIGKRYSDFLMGKRYSDFLMGKRNNWLHKRQGEWIGK